MSSERRWITATAEVWHLSKRCAEAGRGGWRAFPLIEAHDPSFYRPCRRCARSHV